MDSCDHYMYITDDTEYIILICPLVKSRQSRHSPKCCPTKFMELGSHSNYESRCYATCLNRLY